MFWYKMNGVMRGIILKQVRMRRECHASNIFKIEAYNLDKEKYQSYYKNMVNISVGVLILIVAGVILAVNYENMWGLIIAMISSALLVLGAGIILLYTKVLDYLKIKRETPKVIEAIEKYKKGELTMLYTIAETDLSIREFMKVLKKEKIEVEFNESLLGKFEV